MDLTRVSTNFKPVVNPISMDFLGFSTIRKSIRSCKTANIMKFWLSGYKKSTVTLMRPQSKTNTGGSLMNTSSPTNGFDIDSYPHTGRTIAQAQ